MEVTGKIKVELVNSKKLKNNLDISKYDGIILSSGIKIGSWTKHMKKFLKYHQDQLDEFKKPIAACVCSGYASEPEKNEQYTQEYTYDFMATFGIKISLGQAFGGVFDFSQGSKFGFFNKTIIKALYKNDKSIKLDVDYESKNDYRDWEMINKFRDDFIQLINN